MECDCTQIKNASSVISPALWFSRSLFWSGQWFCMQNALCLHNFQSILVWSCAKTQKALHALPARALLFHTIGDFLGYHQVGLDTVTTDGARAVARPTTAGFLLLFPYGTISRHWISSRRDGAGGWLLCDSLHPSPFQAGMSCKSINPCQPRRKSTPSSPHFWRELHLMKTDPLARILSIRSVQKRLPPSSTCA